MAPTLPNTPTSVTEAVEQLVQFFEHLQPQDLPKLGFLYAPDARFKDPFNEVQGLEPIERIFAHMFESLDAPHFIVTERILQDRQCFLAWEFRFRFKRLAPHHWQSIRGGSHLVFDDAGLVSLHRDYWDATEELYEKLPLVGALMRWFKRRVNAPS